MSDTLKNVPRVRRRRLYRIRIARKSFTLVPVGPVTNRSAQRLERRPGVVPGQQRRRVLPPSPAAAPPMPPSAKAPALSSDPSIPSVSAASAANGTPSAAKRHGQQKLACSARPAPCRAGSPSSRRPTGSRRAAQRAGRARPPRARWRHGPAPRRAPRPRSRRTGSPRGTPSASATRRRRLQRQPGRGDHPHLMPREDRIARQRRQPLLAGEPAPPPAAAGRSARPSTSARASARVTASGTVGPDATCAGSSPGTSETTSDTTRAGWHAAASRPPLMPVTCLRIAFITEIGAPEASSARFSAASSSSVRCPGRRRAAAPSRRRRSAPPPDHPAPSPCTASNSAALAASPAASGTGCAASITRIGRSGSHSHSG